MMRRRALCLVLTALFVVGAAAPALACGGLVAPNGTINLVRTSTLAAYVDGIEHYVTSFEFAGKSGGKFGSIVPLPGVPVKVERGGRWTLQRLAQEVAPVLEESFVALDATAGFRANAKVILETKIEALDITILEGGGDAVGRWAEDNGFALTPDAPEVLDFYARRSPIFMAARFNAARAEDRGVQRGDGTPVHLTIPTSNPWVPLRILALGKEPKERIEADVFLLTEREPAILPAAGGDSGFTLEQSREASRLLLADLASDRSMGWLPRNDMWLSYLSINAPAKKLIHDLAVDVTGRGAPSRVAAGLELAGVLEEPSVSTEWWVWLLAVVVASGAVALTSRTIAPRR